MSSPQVIDAREKQLMRSHIMGQAASSGNLSLELEAGRYRVIYASSPHTGLTMGMFFAEKVFMEPILQLRNWMYAIAIGMVLLMFIYTWLSYKGIVAPMNQLVDAMRTVSKGQFKVEIPVKGKNEFSFMSIQFNRMANRINGLVNEVYLVKLKQQQVQLKLLQSQIRPHFLYNSLNMIYLMSMGGNNEGVANMSLYLSKYFRYATKTNQDMVSLRSELDNIRHYIEIQKIQYEDKIIDRIDVPEELLALMVPRLSVQPIVENAIVHGIEQDEGVFNHLWITARTEGRLVKLVIENDGVSLSEDKLVHIRMGLAHFNEEGSGDGLNNTHWRLRLSYGEMAGVQIEAREGGGARVILTLPLPASEGEDGKDV